MVNGFWKLYKYCNWLVDEFVASLLVSMAKIFSTNAWYCSFLQCQTHQMIFFRGENNEFIDGSTSAADLISSWNILSRRVQFHDNLLRHVRDLLEALSRKGGHYPHPYPPSTSLSTVWGPFIISPSPSTFQQLCQNRYGEPQFVNENGNGTHYYRTFSCPVRTILFCQ